jgi:hypothetical protein
VGEATAVSDGVFPFWLVLFLASECFWLETPTRAGMDSMSLAVNFASLYVLPWHLVLTVGAFSVCSADLVLHRRGGLRATFNAAQTVISLAAAAWVIALHRGQDLLTAWRRNFGFGFHYLSSAVLLLIGVTFVVSLQAVGYISGLLYLLLFFFVRDAYHCRSREREGNARESAAPVGATLPG